MTKRKCNSLGSPARRRPLARLPRSVLSQSPLAPLRAAAFQAASAVAAQAAWSARLSEEDEEDLFQNILLRVWEQAERFDPTRGCANTFTGCLARRCAADFLNARSRHRKQIGEWQRPPVDQDGEEASSPINGSDDFSAASAIWGTVHSDLEELELRHALEEALACMTPSLVELLRLLLEHEDGPTACLASGMSRATFYRRVVDLRLHLRMFGLKARA